MQIARCTVLAMAAAALIGCASSAPEPTPPYSVTVLHVNDHHSNLAEKTRTLSWGGQEWQTQSGGFARVAAQIKTLRQQHDNALTLHAGDAITGSLFFTLFGSEADAAVMNAVCFDAFAIGNHEFDKGDQGLKTFLDALGTPSCPTAALSANVKPELGVSPLTATSMTDSFVPWTVVNRGGQRMGIVGLTIADKTKKSSQPDPTTTFENEREAALRAIKALQQQGVEKIILLSHIQYQRDKALIAQLPAVDMVIGGDSHTLLGDFSEFDMTSAGPYPTRLTNADGDTVCLAHAYQYSQVVGELTVTFDGNKVASCEGRPHFLLSDDIQPVEGAVTTLEPIKQALRDSGVFSFVEPDPEVDRLVNQYQRQVDAFANEVVATVPQTICKQDIHQPRRAECGATISSGAHRLTAEAFLHAVPEADFALQNASSIRGDIKAGKFTVGDAYRLLPYANTLVRFNISGSELKQLMEEALSYVVAEDGSTGAYPYGAGIRYEVDLSQNFGDRVANLQVWDKASEQWLPVLPRKDYQLVTNSYIGGGQEGYQTLHSLAQRGRADKVDIDYAQAMADYARSLGVLKRPSEFSTQSYTPNTSRP